MSRRQGSLLARLIEAERRAAVAEHEAEAAQNNVTALICEVKRLSGIGADEWADHEIVLLRKDHDV